jgi:hypothetical protein
MNRFRQCLAIGAAFAFVLAFSAGSAFAVTLTPTDAPLAGSNFQGGDGNQDNPGADVSVPPDGVSDIDWQDVAGSNDLATAIDPNDQDNAFAGGNKEEDPGDWSFVTDAAGVDPSKDNVLADWATFAPSVNGPPSTFLYLAYTREAQTGNTFNTFELNQLPITWNNGQATITCRRTGDLLISYEVASGGSPPNVDIVVYRWTTDTFETDTGYQCAKTGTLTPIDPQPNAEAAVNAADIDNFLPGGLGSTFAEGTFGETALNLTAVLNEAEANPCTDFGQISMHTRSSTDINSELQDIISPVPVISRSCKLKIDKKVSVNDPNGTYQDGPATANIGDTLYYQVVVTNTGSQPLEVTTTDFSNSCGGGLFLSPSDTSPVSMPRSIAGGESETYYCRHVVTADDAAANGGDYVNTACTSGTHDGTPATGDPDSSALCDSVTVHIVPPTPPAPPAQPAANPPNPEQLLLPERITPGSARLLAPTGCQSKAFSARVRGTQIATVVFRVDGNVVARLHKPNANGLFSIRINPARFRTGVHRLVATVTFKPRSGTRQKTLRVSFQRCAKKFVAPRFTG